MSSFLNSILVLYHSPLVVQHFDVKFWNDEGFGKRNMQLIRFQCTQSEFTPQNLWEVKLWEEFFGWNSFFLKNSVGSKYFGVHNDYSGHTDIFLQQVKSFL